MKFLLPLLVLAAACGKYDLKPSGSKVGEALTISPLSSTDRSNLNSICTALAAKSSSAVNGATLTFQSFEGDCTGHTISNAFVQTAIQKIGSENYLVKKLDGGPYIFSDLESPTKGILENICPNLANLDNPVQVGNEQISYNTIGINPEDCTVANEEVCVEVKRASLVDGTYTIHTKEYMRVKVSDSARTGKVGYFTLRKRVTKSYCGLNEQLTFRADLK